MNLIPVTFINLLTSSHSIFVYSLQKSSYFLHRWSMSPVDKENFTLSNYVFFFFSFHCIITQANIFGATLYTHMVRVDILAFPPVISP